MMRRFLPGLLLLLVTGSDLAAQDSGFANGERCTVTADVVSCSPLVGTGSLVITAQVTDFVKLRDALTPRWDGNLTCSECDVAQGFPGCVAAGDVVATTRNKAGLARLTCVLRSIVKQKDQREAVEALPPVAEPVIGGGDPGEEE